MPSQPHFLRRAPLTLVVASLALAGCATLPADGGFAPVREVTRERLGQDVQWTRSDAEREQAQRRIDELLAQPLTQDAAVQIALLNNPGLQADFHALGITTAELVQAGRLPNPGFGFSRLRRGGELELERGWHLDLARLLALPMLRELESRRLAQAQAAATMAVLSLAAETRKAWVQAVAAEESLRYSRQVRQAAEAGAELARRMAQAGNFNTLQQLREQSFDADAAVGVLRAEQARLAARERLHRLLGLAGAPTRWQLPERLPDLPAAPKPLPDVEQTALVQRLDVQTARLASELTARDLGLTRATRFVHVLELGLLNNGSNEAPTQRGWELGFEVPLFDSGDARVARAEAAYGQSVQRLAEATVNARSEIREAHGAYATAWEIARRHRDELVPLKQRIADENVLRYNGMLTGVFELLAEARAQIAGVHASIDALRDFWLADADLEMALVGHPTLTAPRATNAPAAAEPAGGDH
jgi:outer membrane protein TolC